MRWFRKHNTSPMAQRLRERRHAVQLLTRNSKLYRLIPMQLRIVTDAYRLTSTEENAFSLAFGEPMPHHLITALRVERDLWLAIHDMLEHADPSDYQRIVASLRHELATLDRLLTLEGEMHESPLTITFQRRLAKIGAP